jgi:hypothetical protein
MLAPAEDLVTIRGIFSLERELPGGVPHPSKSEVQGSENGAVGLS